jgi:glycosyltransferase involved in cell wall biosynthesis
VALSILHINESDIAGGAARSAYRIHDGLRRAGHTSRMLVGRKLSGDSDVRHIKRSTAWRALDRPFGALTDALDLQYVFYPSSFAVAGDAWFRAADVVQLYNTHGSYFSHTALPLLSRRRPLVWRLSDMWPFTGHVAYSFDCERWRHGCGSCPYLHEYPPLKRDTTALLWRIKRATYARSRLTIVAPSRWIERLVRDSPLLGHFPVHHVPNGIDLDVFRPVAKADARIRLGLAPERPVVLYGAVRMDDRRKGAAELRRALAHLGDVDFDLVVMGEGAPPLDRPVRSLGLLEDDQRIALAYAAADVYVLPALAENLPNVALESLACGTAVAAFDVGGVPDVVRDGETGLLATVGDAEALAARVRTLLADDDLRARLAGAGRDLMEREHTQELEARRLADLYQELVAP